MFVLHLACSYRGYTCCCMSSCDRESVLYGNWLLLLLNFPKGGHWLMTSAGKIPQMWLCWRFSPALERVRAIFIHFHGWDCCIFGFIIHLQLSWKLSWKIKIKQQQKEGRLTHVSESYPSLNILVTWSKYLQSNSCLCLTHYLRRYCMKQMMISYVSLSSCHWLSNTDTIRWFNPMKSLIV